MDTFEVDFTNLTIHRVSKNGDREDLNEFGCPVSTLGELRDLADDLYDCGAYNKRARDEIVDVIESQSEFLKSIK